MSERKVLNKYYPPDFDPTKLPRLKRSKTFTYKVRLMAPFSMRCNTCGQWIYKGTKFNARKEDAEGEKYLGIQVFRFYIRCTRCSAEISFKTDPENTDYICETGASRNFEPWRDQQREREESKKEKEEQEENNPMKALENRTEASRREIQSLDALDEIRALNSRKQKITEDEVIKKVLGEHDQEELDEEELVRAAFSEGGAFVRRAEEPPGLAVPSKVFSFRAGPEKGAEEPRKRPSDTLLTEKPQGPKKPKFNFKVRPKDEPETQAKAAEAPQAKAAEAPQAKEQQQQQQGEGKGDVPKPLGLPLGSALLGLAYGSDDEDGE